MEEPIYDALVREYQYDPQDYVPFDLAMCIAASYAMPRKPVKGTKPRKAASRGRRA